MANRQEEFLEKLESTILSELKTQIFTPTNMNESTVALPTRFRFQIRRQENSLIVTTTEGFLKGNQPLCRAEVRAEKINADLMIGFYGFEPTKRYRRRGTILLGMLLLIPIIVIAILMGYVLEHNISIEPIKTVLLFAGFVGAFFSLVWMLKRIGYAKMEIYDKALTVCIEKTINLFK